MSTSQVVISLYQEKNVSLVVNTTSFLPCSRVEETRYYPAILSARTAVVYGAQVQGAVCKLLSHQRKK